MAIRASDILLTAMTIAAALLPAHGQEVAPSFAVPKNITLQTGDTWVFNGQVYRLYGVQSCIRGSIAIDAAGNKRDCGSLSLAQLGGLFQTATVTCQPIGRARDNAIFAVCAAEIDGSTIDVGTAMISSGFAFAATYPDGNAVNISYVVAELTAKGAGEGLWAYRFPHPVQALLRTSQPAATKGAGQ
ncbi:MAG: thermonuclease family protein [Mesorhizobium sp.]|uniref:thermonuclease family protein n=1 Tax=Mesorhizobium sp. TaxID=1871066 RepID=UPI000FE8F345|nr:thermonuclease family protein [Mesorhizobium sp.]RWG41486.1 MAG: thermonuclease family protein [Mesorhizobium sp.]TIR04092.1 MAG: thermonuclease family protein [Mesorhizobium sp.]